MTPRIVHITIFGRDYHRMLAFYRDVLELPVIATDDQFHYVTLNGGGVRIGLGAGEPGPGSTLQIGGLTGIGFGVPDVDAAYEALKAKGVNFTMLAGGALASRPLRGGGLAASRLGRGVHRHLKALGQGSAFFADGRLGRPAAV